MRRPAIANRLATMLSIITGHTVEDCKASGQQYRTRQLFRMIGELEHVAGHVAAMRSSGHNVVALDVSEHDDEITIHLGNSLDLGGSGE